MTGGPALPANLAALVAKVAVGPGRVRVAALVEDRATHTALTAAFGRAFPGVDQRVVLSYWCQYYFAALVIPAVATAATLGRVLPVALVEVGCDLDARGLPERLCVPHDGHATRPSDAVQEIVSALAADHLRPLIRACASWSGLSRRVLWCNAGVMLDVVARECGIEPTGAWCVDPRDPASPVERLLVQPFRPEERDGTRVRRACCLRLRLPGVPCCGSICPLDGRQTG